ncbi:MAG: IS110 family transposase [candidate division NC10 bacterium]|nr:IS110 family transposase [candidate division NC10 bacterium]
MPTIRPNAIRVKRFRELKESLRTSRDRLLVGIDIAKAQHVAQVRLAHTRTLDKQVTIPNTQAGFDAFWAHLDQRRAETGVREIVCAVEPTGTYHDALARFLESHGAEVVLVSNTVAHFNRRTLDGTWAKSDPKDAHNLCDLLERGHALFYSLPDERTAALRRLVRLLRQARVELGACKARFRNTLLPALGPAGEPLPPALLASLPAPLRRLCPAAGETPRQPEPTALGPGAALPPGLRCELTDLVARLTAVQARIGQLEAALGLVADPLPAYALLRTIPGLGPTLGAILLAEVGDIAWDHEVLSAPEACGTGYHLGGDGELDGDGADLEVRPAAPALGPLPSSPRRVPESRVARPARGDDRQAERGPARLLQGDRRVGGETPAPRLGRLAEWTTL